MLFREDQGVPDALINFLNVSLFELSIDLSTMFRGELYLRKRAEPGQNRRPRFLLLFRERDRVAPSQYLFDSVEARSELVALTPGSPPLFGSITSQERNGGHE
jgi:hypothetical protein